MLSDGEVIEVVELQGEYEEVREAVHRALRQGLMDLGRANYSAGGVGRRYGRDYWDLAERLLLVAVTNGWAVQRVDTEADTGAADTLDNEQPGGACIRNRKGKPPVSETTEEEDTPVLDPFRDPLLMFQGGLVPYQLRLCQTRFQLLLPSLGRLVELQNRIGELMDRHEPGTADQPTDSPQAPPHDLADALDSLTLSPTRTADPTSHNRPVAPANS